MQDPFDIGYIVFVCFVLLGFVAFYLWLWRGRSILGQPTGFRLEEHRRQCWRAIKGSLPPLGVLVLSAADRALDLCHISHIRYAFWSGMIAASDLWLCALLLSNLVTAICRFRAERASPNNPDLIYRT